MHSAQQPVSSQVAKTVLLLIQAFLKTGYYQPGHPETDKAREGLYESVTALFSSHPEITFLANISDDDSEILVGGVAHDYLTMNRVMPRNMADMFLPKLTDFFRRKRLSSFSLRNGISRYEFDIFVDIMTRSGWLEDTKVDACERMSKALVEKEVVNVSVVFLDELVGKGRKLPWRVVANLSRLKRDLNMLPLYRNVDAKVIKRVRCQVFEEIVTPLRDPQLICELLINLDLIVKTLHDFDRDSLAYTLFEYIDPILIQPVCYLVVKELGELQTKQERQGEDPALQRRTEEVLWIARRLGEQLLEGENIDASLFHALVSQKVYLYDELPPVLREEISAMQAIHLLLDNQQQFFAEIEEITAPAMLERRLWHLLEMLPGLLLQGHDQVARQVIVFANRYGKTFHLTNRPQLVERLRRSVSVRAQKESREGTDEMLTTLATLDRIGLEILVDLADHDNRSVRRLGLEALANSGQAAVPVLFAALQQKKGWHFLRNMLILLSRIGAGGPKVEKLFRHCLVHPQANVRIEALQALAKLSGPEAEETIAGLLDDKETEVRQRAVGGLAHTGISQHLTVSKLAALITDDKSGSEAMGLQVVNTLNKLRPPPFPEADIEDALLEIARPKRRFGFGGKQTALSGHLREGVIQALGYVGTERCRSVLKKCSKQDVKIAKIAMDSLGRLDSRKQ